MRLARALTIAACLTDIILVVLLVLEGHRVRLLDITRDLHCTVVTGNNQTVAILQLDILVAAGIGQGLIEVDTYQIGGLGGQLFQTQRVTRTGGCTLSGHLDELITTGQLVFVHVTNEAGTTDVRTGDNTTCCLHHIREALILLLKRIEALEGNLALYTYPERIYRHRTAAH